MRQMSENLSEEDALSLLSDVRFAQQDYSITSCQSSNRDSHVKYAGQRI